MNLNPGTLLKNGEYRIETVLGQGGFGITYLATHVLLDDKVAVKEFFMKDYCNRDKDSSHVLVGTETGRELVERFRQKFMKEARNIRKMKHPGIVRVLDVFEDNGTSYYVMEHVSGGSLADKVKNGALSEDVAVNYIRQVASAVGYIHGKQMMHLDVKPSNVLVDENDNAVLIDFGLAKQYDNEGRQTSTTPVGISHGYAPIEQYKRGGVSSFSPATDIYSLGATLYRMVTGLTPPDASDVSDDGLPEMPQSISVSVRSAIEAAMQPRRKDRLQSVDSLLELLDGNGNVDAGRKVVVPPLFSGSVATENDNTEFVDKRSNMFGMQVFNIKGTVFNMVVVEGGTFNMGKKAGSLELESDRRLHNVTIDTYYIGETLVTQGLWLAVMGRNPSKSNDDLQAPVDNVSWEDCQDFIMRLNMLTGRKFRLPTEAEWEFAARGGNASTGYKYSGSNRLDDVAWYDGNSDEKTHPVKLKLPNELGIYDMSGNVWEWCSDWYGDYPSSDQINPKGAKEGLYRVLRGGGYDNRCECCAVSWRARNLSVKKDSFYGLRLALEI